MKTMNDLQSLIEKRASEKLDADIRDYFSKIRSNPLFKQIEKLRINTTDKKEVSLEDFFYPPYTSDIYGYSIIFKALLPEYIERESKEFLSKVDTIKEEIDNLLDQRNNY